MPTREELLKQRAELQARLEQVQTQPAVTDAEQLQLAGTAANRPLRPVSGSIFGPEREHRQSQADQKAMDDARQQLLNMKDKDPKQVDAFIQSQKTRFPIGQTAGDIAGSTAGAATGAKIAAAIGQIPPFTAFPEEAITVPIGAFIGGIIGAGLGGAAGEAAQQAVSPRERVDMFDVKRAGLESAIWEGGGRLAFGAIKKIGPSLIPGGKNVKTPQVQDAIEIIESKGGFLTANQEDVSRFRNSLESLLRGTSAGSKHFDSLDIAQKDKLVAYGLDMVNRIAGDGIASAGGATGMEITQGALAREIDSVMAARGGARKSLLDSIIEPSYKSISIRSNAQLPTDEMLDFIDGELIKDKRVRHLTSQARTEAKSLKTLLKENPAYTIDEMRQFRSSRVGDAARYRGLGDKSSQFFDRLAIEADNALFDPKNTIGLSEELALELRDLNTFYATTRQMYDDSIVLALARQIDDQPEIVLNTLFKSYDPERVATLKEFLTTPTITRIRDKVTTSKDVTNEVTRALGRVASPDIQGKIIANNVQGELLWKKVNGYWIANAINESIDKNGKFVRGRFREAWEGLPTQTKKLMFGNDIVKEINKFDNAIQVHTKGRPMAGPELIGRRSEQIGGALAVAGGMGAAKGLSLGKGIMIGAGGTLLIAPGTLSKLVTSKKGNKLLKLGFDAIPGSPEIATIGNKMVRFVTEADTEDERRSRKAAAKQEFQKALMDPAEFRKKIL